MNVQKPSRGAKVIPVPPPLIYVLAFVGGMFLRAHTTVIPHRRVSALVTSGPLRVSCNPMYTAFASITIGAALVIGTWWPLVTLIPALLVIRIAVIGPEERYLAETFGEDFAAYRANVRRWL